MTILWSAFVPGLCLLLYPADRLLSSLVELRGFSYFHTLENSPRHRPWWWVPMLWLDPPRAFAGTWLLAKGLALHHEPWKQTPKDAFVCFVATIVIAILSQTYTRRGESESLLAPMGFIAGVTIALVPWPVTLLGLAIGIIGMFAFRQFDAFFICSLFGVALLGFLLGAGVMSVVVAAGAFAIPIVVAYFSGRSLDLPTHNARIPKPATGPTA